MQWRMRPWLPVRRRSTHPVTPPAQVTGLVDGWQPYPANFVPHLESSIQWKLHAVNGSNAERKRGKVVYSTCCFVSQVNRFQFGNAGEWCNVSMCMCTAYGNVEPFSGQYVWSAIEATLKSKQKQKHRSNSIVQVQLLLLMPLNFNKMTPLNAIFKECRTWKLTIYRHILELRQYMRTDDSQLQLRISFFCTQNVRID